MEERGGSDRTKREGRGNHGREIAKRKRDIKIETVRGKEGDIVR